MVNQMYGLKLATNAREFFARDPHSADDKIEDALCGLLCTGVPEDFIEVHRYPWKKLTQILVLGTCRYTIDW